MVLEGLLAGVVRGVGVELAMVVAVVLQDRAGLGVQHIGVAEKAAVEVEDWSVHKGRGQSGVPHPDQPHPGLRRAARPEHGQG
jgi:hypothetical protein